MINLLPPKEKRSLLMERNKRIAIILWFLLLFFLVCLILILFSIKIYLKGQIDSHKAFLAKSEEEFLQSESEEFQKKIESANTKFQKLSSFYNQRVYFSQVLGKISAIVPANLYLTEISLAYSKEGDKINGSISGYAPFIEDVIKLEDSFKKEKQFQEVNFPLSNWVKETDIDFYVTFSIYP